MSCHNKSSLALVQTMQFDLLEPSWLHLGLSPVKGSSKNKTEGSCKVALAIAILCCIPLE